MVANTDNLSPTDRASVLKIIDGWNNPTVIDLEQAKLVRRGEAHPVRQRGVSRFEPYENWVPHLTPGQRAFFEERGPVLLSGRRQRIRLRPSNPEVLSYAQLVASYWKDIAPYRFE